VSKAAWAVRGGEVQRLTDVKGGLKVRPVAHGFVLPSQCFLLGTGPLLQGEVPALDS
jgi:hypothetical protein